MHTSTKAASEDILIISPTMYFLIPENLYAKQQGQICQFCYFSKIFVMFSILKEFQRFSGIS